MAVFSALPLKIKIKKTRRRRRWRTAAQRIGDSSAVRRRLHRYAYVPRGTLPGQLQERTRTAAQRIGDSSAVRRRLHQEQRMFHVEHFNIFKKKKVKKEGQKKTFFKKKKKKIILFCVLSSVFSPLCSKCVLKKFTKKEDTEKEDTEKKKKPIARPSFTFLKLFLFLKKKMRGGFTFLKLFLFLKKKLFHVKHFQKFEKKNQGKN